MISAEDFYKDYYSLFQYRECNDDKMKIYPAITYNDKFIFSCLITESWNWYEFNMLKPEVIAVNAYGEKYVPLTMEDVDRIMYLLKDKGVWNDLITGFTTWANRPDFDDKYHTLETIKKIPATPPDYRLIWENGYTGKEDYDFVSCEYD